MRTDTPPEGVTGSHGLRCARGPLALTLAAVALVTGPVAADAGRIDPRDEGFRVAEVAPSPDGRWVAMKYNVDDESETGVWLVDLRGEVADRSLTEDIGRRALTWSAEGRLAIGRLWIDPVTGEGSGRVVPSRADVAGLSGGWARETVRKRSSAVTHEIEWVARKRVFELEGTDELQVRITSAPGVVFYSTRERDVVRVHRYDFATGESRDLRAIGSGSQAWDVSPDGRSISVRDESRLRVIDGAHGDLIAGPWADGELTWLEHDGSRFVQIERAGRAYLVDILLAREIDLGVSGTRAHVLPDGRFLVHEPAGLVEVIDPQGVVLRLLVPAKTRG